MLTWLTANLGTILVSIALVAIVAAIIIGMHKEKKKGKPACGGDCSHCGGCPSCHMK